jgi:hypothetical protein
MRREFGAQFCLTPAALMKVRTNVRVAEFGTVLQETNEWELKGLLDRGDDHANKNKSKPSDVTDGRNRLDVDAALPKLLRLQRRFKR